MKKKYITGLLLAALNIPAFASYSGTIEPLNKEQLSALDEKQAEERVKTLSLRVSEIREKDLRKLPKEERKELKSEMREIKKELDFLNNRVTLSVGALIIIVLLIILIF